MSFDPTFTTLGLDPAVLRSAAAAGYTVPTPVQMQTIPPALEGKDVLASSQTGSGKTAAFLLPALHRLALAQREAGRPNRGASPRVLVLAPTRELALQVQKAAFEFSREVRGVRTAALVGGTPYGLQLRALREGADIVVATPGRLIDHLKRGSLDLSQIELLVLDEADRMLDMGFIDDIETIVSKTPPTRQTMLFSATLDGIVGKLAQKHTRSPLRVQVAASVADEASIAQSQLHADGFGHKGRLLDALLRDVSLTQALVFTATKKSAEDLSLKLIGQGFPAAALHGDMQQSERNRTLHLLRNGRIRVLVATDVAARGIDIAGITHVINFDVPRQAEDYVHRIGRTGRAGRSGAAITFVAPEEHGQMKSIERFTGQSIQVMTLPGLEPTVAPRRASPGRPAATRWRSAARPAFKGANNERRPSTRGGYDGKSDDSRGYGSTPTSGADRKQGAGGRPKDARRSFGDARS